MRCKYCDGTGLIGFQRECCWFCGGTGIDKRKEELLQHDKVKKITAKVKYIGEMPENPIIDLQEVSNEHS